MLTPRDWLAAELERRCRKNTRYSLRAFAKTLSITPSALSMILSGKRGLTRKSAAKIAEALGLNPGERETFLNGSTRATPEVEFERIHLDTFAVISDWHHFAILSLIDTEDFTSDFKWIAKRLAISVAEAKMAVARLVRLGLLDISGQRWRQIGKPLKVENTVSTAATRKFQRQILEKALESLEEDPMPVRDLSSMTLAMHPDQVPFAVAEIRKFRRRLMRQLEDASRGRAREVYNLSVQIYPISKRRSTQ